MKPIRPLDGRDRDRTEITTLGSISNKNIAIHDCTANSIEDQVPARKHGLIYDRHL